jgi:hypothetical protein
MVETKNNNENESRSESSFTSGVFHTLKRALRYFSSAVRTTLDMVMESRGGMVEPVPARAPRVVNTLPKPRKRP